MVVEWLFLAVPRGCLQFVIVVFPDHTHLLFFLCITGGFRGSSGSTVVKMPHCWKSNVAVQMKNCYIKFSFEVWYIKVASLAPMVSVTIDYL